MVKMHIDIDIDKTFFLHRFELQEKPIGDFEDVSPMQNIYFMETFEPDEFLYL